LTGVEDYSYLLTKRRNERIAYHDQKRVLMSSQRSVKMGKRTKADFVVRVVSLAVLFFSFTVPPAAYAQNTTIEERPTVDEEALKILKKATDYLTGLNQLHLKAYKERDVVQESGQKLQFSGGFEVSLKRPDRLFASQTDDDGNIRRLWYDGKTVTMYDEKEKVYGQISAGETIDEMLDYLEIVIQYPLPLADLFYNDLSSLSGRARSGMYLGISFVENSACDHLAFRGESVDWQCWVERGEKPLIRKIVITYKEISGEPQLSARLSEWDVNLSLSDTLFQFSKPEDARRIQVLGSKRPNPQKRGEQ
jgi:hypothetical protein